MPIPAAGTMFLEEWTPAPNSRSKCIVVTTSAEAEDNGWGDPAVPAYLFYHRRAGGSGPAIPVREPAPMDLEIIEGPHPSYVAVTDDR